LAAGQIAAANTWQAVWQICRADALDSSADGLNASICSPYCFRPLNPILIARAAPARIFSASDLFHLPLAVELIPSTARYECPATLPLIVGDEFLAQRKMPRIVAKFGRHLP